MLKEIFHWLDAHPILYWLVAAAAMLLLAGWIIRGLLRRADGSTRSQPEWVLGLLLLAVLLAWRWPPLFGIQAYNPDEAQVIAGALTLQHDPVFWRSVDGNTSGPLNFYALLPTHWLGVPQDYFNARLTGLLLVWGALWSCYRLLRFDFGPSVAALGLLPGLFFFATAIDTDFIQYSTEHLPFFLFTFSAALLWQAHRQGLPGQAYPLRPWLAAGLLMGLLPWSKLQAAPLAATLAAWGTVLALTKPARSWPARFSETGRLAAAALAPGLLILLLVGGTGQWPHFVSSYLINNLAYVNSDYTVMSAVREFIRLCQFTWNFPGFLPAPLLTVAAAGLMAMIQRRRPGPLFLLGALFTAVACFCVLAPRRGYPHYLLFLILPMTWWSGAALGELWQHLRWPRQRLLLGLGFVLLTGVVSLLVRAREPKPLLFGELETNWRQPYDEAGRLLRRLRQPDDCLAVWGWNCHLHVQSGLPQATREAVSERQISESVQRDTYYRPRYLADLERNQPAFFVDAVGPGAFGFTERATHGHESFAALRDYVQSHYRLLRDLAYARIYVRVDRWPEAAKPPAGGRPQPGT